MVAQERQYVLNSLSSSSSSSSKGSSSNSNKNSSSKNSSSSKDMPEALKQKIVEGKMNKWYKETVLLKQVRMLQALNPSSKP